MPVFDLVMELRPKLSATERRRSGKRRGRCSRALERGKLVDWRKKQTAKAQMQVTIQRMLAEGLPRAYSLVEMREKAEIVYQHVYDAYAGEGRGLYG
ncbi:MAG: type restriction enzyme subunit [Thermomicrobiales bacterium]|jgi:type I restriction enzyme R subunit|nr:type restriction enzyme subunit [Thermomicrobiales bacterium]